MQIISITDPQAQTLTLEVLKQGGLVICPTETVYGAMVDATNPQAVKKLLTYKKRPPGKALSIACTDQAMAAQYVSINDQAAKIYQTLLPGPITVVSANLGKVVPDIVSEFDTLGVRIPAYPFLLDLIAQYQLPLTATSANSSGKKTPYCLNDILTHLSSKQKSLIDLIIDAGTLPPNPPSLVIDTTLSTPIVLRDNHQVQASAVQSGTQFITNSPSQTQALAGKILLKHFSLIQTQGLLIALDGELGAGKTTFTQGIAKFLQIQDQITSPTYTYLKEYPFQKYDHVGMLYHLDCWTIDQAATLNSLNLPSLQKPSNLIVIEWYDNLTQFFQPTLPLLKLKLSPTPHPNERQLILSPLPS